MDEYVQNAEGARCTVKSRFVCLSRTQMRKISNFSRLWGNYIRLIIYLFVHMGQLITIHP